MVLPKNDPIWIDRPAALASLVKTLMVQPVIGVDTESNSLYAYHEQVCLIQFSTELDDYLVDALAMKDLSPLGPVFASSAIEKVFHASEYDLICMKRDYGFDFTSIFDTMMAARILGRPNLGLGSMLEEEFGIQVDKRLQRANWARRPLSRDMLMYARMDTHYLIPLRKILFEELVSTNRLGLAEEDFRRLTRVPAGTHDNGSQGWWRISGVQDLSPRQCAVLMELCTFREERARAQNQPPFRILPNQTLMELSQRMPRKRSELSQIFGLSPKLIDRYGADILAAVERGIVGPPAYRPAYNRPNDAVLARSEALRTWRKITAREMGVESDVILPRDIVDVLATQDPHNQDDLNALLSDFPWRLDHFGRQILNVLNQAN